jgi:Polyketide cyclase / dehydrase and lipid transport
MVAEIPRRTKLFWDDETIMPANPEKVFPLLCPVREFEWLPVWDCQMIHSEMGVAEDGCVFQTDFPNDGRMTWVVSVYEPPSRIEFTCLVPDLFVMRLKLRLRISGVERTTIEWRREFRSLTKAGDRHLAECKTEAARRDMMAMLEHDLREFLIRNEELQPAGSRV